MSKYYYVYYATNYTQLLSVLGGGEKLSGWLIQWLIGRYRTMLSI